MQEEIKNQETVEETVEEEVQAEESKKDKKKNKKAEAEISELKEQLLAKEKEIAELNDKYLRLYAEYDNFRPGLNVSTGIRMIDCPFMMAAFSLFPPSATIFPLPVMMR